MALTIKDREVEQLAEEVAELTGGTKTQAVRWALAGYRRRLLLEGTHRDRGSAFLRYLAEEVWPHAPAGQLGRRLTREEEEAILGLGPEGV
jgi:antitoxin VapB